MAKARLFIVHESLAWRSALQRALESTDEVEVAVVSPTARLALRKLGRQAPDVVLLSLSLPDSQPNELEAAVLKHSGAALIGLQHGPPLSTSAAEFATSKAAATVSTALDPNPSDVDRIVARVLACGARWRDRPARPPSESLTPTHGRPIELIVIGASTGGPTAVGAVLAGLPASLPVPVAVVVHLPDTFSSSLARSFATVCAVQVKEAVEGEVMRPGHVYVAGTGAHLAVGRNPCGQLYTRLKYLPAENGVRPAVDVLFRYAQRICGGATLAVIMTGMGSDGTLGIRQLKESGALVLAQDEASSVVWGMPGRAVLAGLVDEIVPLGDLAKRIAALAESRA